MTGGIVEGKEIGEAGREKYCLRPRGSLRRRKARNRFDNEEINDANSSLMKHKPPPLSKYRRKTANARERSRMRDINLAFETLRRAVPSDVPQLAFHGDGTNEKLTKITTLRLAMRYIAGLVDLLRNEERSSDIQECIESYVNYYPKNFRQQDHDTFTSLNSAGSCFNSAILSFNDSGSSCESFNSAASVENFVEQFVENVPQLNLTFPEANLLSTELR